MMKKNAIALSVAALVGGLGFAGGASANAIAAIGGGGGTGTAGTPPSLAINLQINNGGIGHSLLVPYYTVQNGNSTLINVVNTDTVNGKAVKVRFRGASNSDDVFDFQLYMSPGDHWSASISQAADGRAALYTEDKSCTLPADINRPFVLDRLPASLDADGKAAQTREGYVEIFNMADIPPRFIQPTLLYDNTKANPLYTAIKHVNAVPPCGDALNALSQNPTTEVEAAALGLQAPTAGLFGNFSIVNMQGAATSWTGEATSILATLSDTTVDDAPFASTGNIVFFPQTGATAPDPDFYTADPSLRTTASSAPGGVQNGAGLATPVSTPVIQAAMFDLPDMSTPYINDVGTVVAPLIQAASLTQAIARTSISNEYLTEPGIQGATDWVFSMPTRRYSVAVDYRPSGFVRVYSNLGQSGVFNGRDYFNASNTSLNAGQVCVSADALRTYDREESTSTSGFVISPGTASVLRFCGEVSVLSFNAGGVGSTNPSVLGAMLARQDLDAGYNDGWAKVTTNGISGYGLPILGRAYVKATNPAIAQDKSANFGGSWEHRFTKSAVPTLPPVGP